MNTNKKKIIYFIIIILIITIAPVVYAEDGVSDVLKNLVDTGNPAYNTENFGENNISVVIGQIIQTVLGFLGVIFVVLIIWSGFQWMTAGGNSDTITKARQRIINAVIGLVIILAAYAITHFVINEILDATEGPISIILSNYV